MNLSEVIRENMDAILTEWDAFAESLDPTPAGMSAAELRDDARQIIKTLASDIELPQTPSLLSSSLPGGQAGTPPAASVHGALRQMSGFSLPQVRAEYVSLRISILRLWQARHDVTGQRYVDAEILFDAAIAAAVFESVESYVRQEARLDAGLRAIGNCGPA